MQEAGARRGWQLHKNPEGPPTESEIDACAFLCLPRPTHARRRPSLVGADPSPTTRREKLQLALLAATAMACRRSNPAARSSPRPVGLDQLMATRSRPAQFDIIGHLRPERKSHVAKARRILPVERPPGFRAWSPILNTAQRRSALSVPPSILARRCARRVHRMRAAGIFSSPLFGARRRQMLLCPLPADLPGGRPAW